MTDVSKSAYYPMVGAFAEVATADDSFLGEADEHKAYTIGARLQWNLFNGGVDYHKVQEAKIEQLLEGKQDQTVRRNIARIHDALPRPFRGRRGWSVPGQSRI